ncbi:MAG TPA: phage tail protein [Burkholderiales bacterium]|nr:phage tail protein [Burkholderiales bacterium]
MRRDELDQLLPGVFQQTLHDDTGARKKDLLNGLLDAMACLLEPTEARLVDIDAAFDPRRTEASFVPFLARWVDLAIPFSTGLGHARELVAHAVQLSQWRGTPRGLQGFLEIATGVTGFEIDENVPGEDGSPRPFHIRVTAPASTERHRAMIERIIDQEKPAYVTKELQFAETKTGAS